MTTRKQQEVWRREHTIQESIPSLSLEEPSSAVVDFVQYLEKKGIRPPQRIVDIGCGKGRNAIYLARLGFEVYCMDYIKEAVDRVRRTADEPGLLRKIHLYVTEIDKRWPFTRDYFDIAVDCFSSIDIETRKGRDIYKWEMFRTLKPGGLALVAVVSADDELERELIKASPGPERNSAIWPQTGKFQKDYYEEELRAFYKEFQIVELREVKKKALKLGKAYTATNFWVVVQKLNH